MDARFKILNRFQYLQCIEESNIYIFFVNKLSAIHLYNFCQFIWQNVTNFTIKFQFPRQLLPGDKPRHAVRQNQQESKNARITREWKLIKIVMLHFHYIRSSIQHPPHPQFTSSIGFANISQLSISFVI